MKAILFFAGCGSLVTLLTSCNVAPHYATPVTTVPSNFKEAVTDDPKLNVGWKLASPSDEKSRGAWWEIYQDPVLNDLAARVAKANQTVVAAEARFREARALVVGSRGALLPTLSVSPSVVRSRSSGIELNRNTTSSSSGVTSGSSSSTTTSAVGTSAPVTRTVYTLPVEASYEFDLWHRVRNTIAQNANAAEASAADLANVLLSAQAELAQDYFQLRGLDEQGRLLESSLGDYQASLDIVNTLYGSGMASDEDVARATTQVKTAEAQQTDLLISRAQYEHAIAVLTGQPPANFTLAPALFPSRAPEIPVGLPLDLLERRPDVAGAERLVAAANAGIGVARAAYFPELSLNASGGFESTMASQLLKWPSRFWSVGPTLAETVFDGGVRRALSERARASYDEAVANYRQGVLAALQSVEDSLSTLRLLAHEAQQEAAASASSLQAVRLSVTRYREGIDSYVNVITAQNSFLSSRQTELQVKMRALTASVGLIKNLGGGWEASNLPKLSYATRRSPTRPNEKTSAASRGAPSPGPIQRPQATPEDLLQKDETEIRGAPGF